MFLKTLTFLLLCFYSLLGTASGTGCHWGTTSSKASDIDTELFQSKDAFSELDATFDKKSNKGIPFSFKDAVSCQSLTNVRIQFRSFKGTTDHQGKVTVPMKYFRNINDGRIVLTAKKSGYITLQTKVPVMVGTTWKKQFIMTERMKNNQARIILQWQKKPRDLDLHLIGSNGMHISYRDMKSYQNLAQLDRDDTNGHGPETITLLDISPNVKYTIKVNSYSGEAFKGREYISIYMNNKLKEVIRIRSTSKKWVEAVEFSQHSYLNKLN